MKSVLVKVAIYISVVFFYVGCATQGSMPNDEYVTKLAQKRLDALIARDFKKAYSFASPGYRATVPRRSHHPKIAGARNWLGANVVKAKCSEDVCDLSTEIKFRIAHLQLESKTYLSERWIKIDGKWWIYHR